VEPTRNYYSDQSLYIRTFSIKVLASEAISIRAHRAIGDVTPMEFVTTITTSLRQRKSQLRWPWCNKRGKDKGIFPLS
jgi:hypothetical protein